MRGKWGKEKGEGVEWLGGRERSSRLVVNGVLVESQLSPKTQESICQVFRFDTKAANFEESMGQVWPHRCTFVVKELIETERAYVQALGDIIKVYNTLQHLAISLHTAKSFQGFFTHLLVMKWWIGMYCGPCRVYNAHTMFSTMADYTTFMSVLL